MNTRSLSKQGVGPHPHHRLCYIVKVCVASVAVFHEYVVSLQTRAGELGVGDGESKLCPDTSSP